MITRKNFFALTRLDTDTHSALKRRDQIPFSTESGRNAYSLFDALTFLMADYLAGSPDGLGMNRTMATLIVRDVGSRLVERADDIEANSFVDPEAPIFAGRIARQVSGNEPFCGTSAELAEALASGPTVVAQALVNVSLEFSVLRERCHLQDIEMTDVWPEPGAIRSFEEIREERRAGLRRAVDAANARRCGSA